MHLQNYRQVTHHLQMKETAMDRNNEYQVGIMN